MDPDVPQLDARAAQGWFKTSLLAALAAMAITAVILYSPLQLQLILIVGVVVFLLVLLSNPIRWYRRMSGAAMGAAITAAAVPSINARLELPSAGIATFILDHHWSIAAILVLASVAFGILDYLYIRRPARGQSATSTGSGAAIASPVSINGDNNFSPGVADATLNKLLDKIPDSVPRPMMAVAQDSSPSNIPPRSATFIPRKGITAEIHRTLQANPNETIVRQAVTRAMGGYGKTVAVILYAHEYAEHFPGGRFFLPMESGDVVAGLASLALHLDLPGTNNPAADAAAVCARLRTGKPTLLILDNIASKAAWDAILATNLVPFGACRVLVTTRDEAIDPADAIKIGRLTNDEAREIYRLFCEARHARKSGDRNRAPDPLPTPEIADAITDWLGGLAVAVAAVAAFMKLKPHISWDMYWTGDGKNLRGLKNTPVAELPEVKPEVAAMLGLSGKPLEDHRRTLRVIDDALDALPAPERRAVEYAALLPQDLAPAPWLRELLESDATRSTDDNDYTLHPAPITLTPDPDEPRPPTEIVLAHLDELDVLLPGPEDGKLLSLHRLWHARLNERTLEHNPTPFLRSVAVCAANRHRVIIGTFPGSSNRGVNDPAALTDKALRWELTPLTAVCMGQWEIGHAGEAARIGVWLAPVLTLLGRFTEAAACLALSPDTDAGVEEALGREGFAASYSNLASIQQYQGDLAAARASMERAIQIDLTHLPEDHPALSTSYSNLALIQKEQGELSAAYASIQRAIQIARKHFPEDHSTFGTHYSNLAGFQHAQGDLAAARGSMERAIQVERKHFHDHHPTLAISFNNFARILWEQSDCQEAIRVQKCAIVIMKKHFGPEHPHRIKFETTLARMQRELNIPGQPPPP